MRVFSGLQQNISKKLASGKNIDKNYKHLQNVETPD
jgi:hypothetical protein